MNEPTGDSPKPTADRDAVAMHALPAPFVAALFAALLGGMVPGIYMTLVSAPGNTGSPVYGMILPWTVLPFLLAVAAAWRARFAASGWKLARMAIAAALLGLGVYTYFMLFHPRGVRNIRVFLWLPLWQWLLMARPMTRCAFGAVPAPKPGDGD